MTKRLVSLALCLLVAGAAVAEDAAAPTATPLPAEATEEQAAPASAKPVADIDLETTAIKGSQELPRVLVIVPWKKARPGQLEGRPANSLLDEALAPIDREVFARQLGFYTQLNTDTTEE